METTDVDVRTRIHTSSSTTTYLQLPPANATPLIRQRSQPSPSGTVSFVGSGRSLSQTPPPPASRGPTHCAITTHSVNLPTTTVHPVISAQRTQEGHHDTGLEIAAQGEPGEVLPKGVVSSVGSAGFFPDRPPSRRRLGGFKGLPRPENCKQHSKLLQGGDAARLGRTAQPNAVCGATEPIEVT